MILSPYKPQNKIRWKRLLSWPARTPSSSVPGNQPDHQQKRHSARLLPEWLRFGLQVFRNSISNQRPKPPLRCKSTLLSGTIGIRNKTYRVIQLVQIHSCQLDSCSFAEYSIRRLTWVCASFENCAASHSQPGITTRPIRLAVLPLSG